MVAKGEIRSLVECRSRSIAALAVGLLSLNWNARKSLVSTLAHDLINPECTILYVVGLGFHLGPEQVIVLAVFPNNFFQARNTKMFCAHILIELRNKVL